MTAFITPLYAALFGLLFVALSVRTLRIRRRLKIAVGHGDNPLLHRAIRVHSNFAEYVPITLLLIFFVELQTHASVGSHALCAALLIGRSVHAIGLSRVDEDTRLRVAGMALTFIALISSATRLLIHQVIS